jgi:hypothetical protein
VIPVAVGWCWCVHATSMAHQAGAEQAARQVDNAQTRVNTLNGELGSMFKRWYPDMQVGELAKAS